MLRGWRAAWPISWPTAGVQILNDVVLNQVLAAVRRRRAHAGGHRPGPGRRHRLVGRHDLARLGAMRISVSNWSTSEADADASVQAILRAAAEVDRA